ncbi:MAG: S1 RNA-binding domain-containing protein [Oscillospiraceae bacterium]|nr:S1 RNA-binding domain-containing protein [Oscillospiraceae bacterium]
MIKFPPEGYLIKKSENLEYQSSIEGLRKAMEENIILETKADMCTSSHDLIVNLPCMNALMPREECAIGIAEGKTKDIAIISRVGRPVMFNVTGFIEKQGIPSAILSRRKAQEKCITEYLSQLSSGEVIDAKVTHIEQFGCFVDIGCGIPSMIPIDEISVSRISSPADRFTIGESIKAVYKGTDGDKFYISHKELLGSWEENADMFSAGETVRGIVRSVESYGIFVELAPNLAGLAEPKEGVEVGQTASVYIKSINPEKMKIKLIIVDVSDTPLRFENRYFITDGIIDRWQYSPDNSSRLIETVFQ